MSDCSTHAFDVPLKPCPFCGGEAELRDDGETGFPFFVQCVECGGMTCGHLHADTSFGAIAAWNTRAERTCKAYISMPRHNGERYAKLMVEQFKQMYATLDNVGNSRAERTCECIKCVYFENKSTCGAYCDYFDRELGDDYDGGCTWGAEVDA